VVLTLHCRLNERKENHCACSSNYYWYCTIKYISIQNERNITEKERSTNIFQPLKSSFLRFILLTPSCFSLSLSLSLSTSLSPPPQESESDANQSILPKRINLSVFCLSEFKHAFDLQADCADIDALYDIIAVQGLGYA
jgi:hypothetical protein